MHLLVVRKWLDDNSSIGEMSVDSIFQCFTLEDKVRAPGIKIQNKTAIPYGIYRVTMDYSPHFSRYLPHIQDVPMFSQIRIHPGNDQTNTEGCILVGSTRGDDYIFQSKLAFTALMNKMALIIGFDDVNRVPIYELREDTDIVIIEQVMLDNRTSLD